jgi:hypothetical protein
MRSFCDDIARHPDSRRGPVENSAAIGSQKRRIVSLPVILGRAVRDRRGELWKVTV